MAQALTDQALKRFLDKLSSASPTPGGGSVAALSGALGAALVGMVCNLTLGKKEYAAVQEEVADLLKRSERLRHQLTELLEADARVYARVSQTMKMPCNSAQERAARAAALEEALKAATEVPLQVAETCAAVMDMCRPAAEKGNVNAVSDAGVAVLMAEAGLRSAALNALINLGWIKDQAFVKEHQSRLDALLEGRLAVRDEVYAFVMSQL